MLTSGVERDGGDLREGTAVSEGSRTAYGRD